MMQPKRLKYRKPHRTRYDGKAKGNKYVAFGEYGLMATEGNWLTENQLEALRVVLSTSPTAILKRDSKSCEFNLVIKAHSSSFVLILNSFVSLFMR